MRDERKVHGAEPNGADRGPFCPTESQLAAYADERLSGEARETVERHLADCDHCMDVVGFLARTEHLGPSPEVPAHLLDAVRDAEADGRSTGWAQKYKWLATAAGLVLVVFSVRFGLIDGSQAPAGNAIGVEAVDTGQESRDVRNQLPQEAVPSVVHPAEGQALPRSALTLAWEPVADALEYSVLVMNAAGDLVWEDRTGAQTTRVPADVALAPGERFYVRVTAHLRNGLDIKSPAVAFELTSE